MEGLSELAAAGDRRCAWGLAGSSVGWRTQGSRIAVADDQIGW
jgi:hypothetical protein